MLYNQNNCAAEGGPLTTKYEVEVGTGLCEMVGYDGDQSMGHLLSGGSMANVEGIWVARNLKFFALGLQEAVKNEPKLEAARSYTVFVPELNKNVPLLEAKPWQLLNLDIDTIIWMPEDVETMAGIEHTELMEIMNDYAYESIGALEFGIRHGLKKSPCFLIATTCHVCFLKAATVLGLGKGNIVYVPVDDHARMNPKGEHITLNNS